MKNARHIQMLSQLSNTKGAALIVTLVLLTLVTLVSVNGAHSVTIQEKVVANTYDRSLALQEAEAALREGELLAEAQSKLVPANSGFPANGLYTDTDDTCPAGAVTNCTNGLCGIPDKDCEDRWNLSSFNKWKDATTKLTSLSGTPKYVVEYIGGNFLCANGGTYDPKDCKRYRITAYSNAADGRALVMLQSIYATD